LRLEPRDDVLAATRREQEPFVYASLPSEPFFFRARRGAAGQLVALAHVPA
jgi:hypothetical protein